MLGYFALLGFSMFFVFTDHRGRALCWDISPFQGSRCSCYLRTIGLRPMLGYFALSGLSMFLLFTDHRARALCWDISPFQGSRCSWYLRTIGLAPYAGIFRPFRALDVLAIYGQ